MKSFLDPLKRLYHWTVDLGRRPYASLALSLVAFAEASFFPIPPDVVLLPMCIARPRRSFLYALNSTVSSAFGGVLGYYIGAYLFDSFGRALLALYHLQSRFDAAKEVLMEYQFLAIFLAALTPVPYKLLTISAGIMNFSLLTVVLASLAGRGLRYFAIAAVVYALGENAEEYIDRHFEKITLGVGVLLILLYLFFKNLHLMGI